MRRLNRVLSRAFYNDAIDLIPSPLAVAQARQLSGQGPVTLKVRKWVDSCPQKSMRFRGKVRRVVWIEIQRADVEL